MSKLWFLVLACQLITTRATKTKHVSEPFIVRICSEVCVGAAYCHRDLYVKQKHVCHLPNGTRLGLTARRKQVHPYTIIPEWKEFLLLKVRELCQQIWSTPRIHVKGYVRFRACKETIAKKQHKKKLTWFEAQRVCQSEGGDLIKVDSKLKNRILNEDISYVGRFVHYWIGLSDLDQDNIYKWTDGSPLVYTSWYRRKRLQKDKMGERCVYQRNELWHADSCNHKQMFICERQ